MHARLETVTTATAHSTEVGDVFGMKLTNLGWLLGRVVVVGVADNPQGEIEPDAVLIYVYRYILADEPDTVPASLPVEDLLMAPMLTFRDLWSTGMVKHIGTRAIADGEALRQHCFQFLNRWCDEYAHPLPHPTEPCGLFGITTVSGIENAICDALGAEVLESDEPESCAEDEIIVFIDTTRRSVDIDGIESAISACLGIANGELTGHGFDMDYGIWDLQISCAYPQVVFEALEPTLRSFALPEGSYALVGGDPCRRVELSS